MTPQHFATMARYNRWANGHLYDAVAGLSDADYRRDRRAFFGSIHGTLNHILAGDRIWLGRLEGVESRIESLDQILFETFEPLRDARAEEDKRIEKLTQELTESVLNSPLTYTNMAGDPFESPRTWVLTHVFNHQTHHRGQVHDMLSQSGVTPPPLDLIFFLREIGVA